MMFGVKKKIIEKELPCGIYNGKVSLDCKFDYELLQEILPSKALIAVYESVSGISIPDKYKKELQR